MVPSLPDASMPWSTSTTLRLRLGPQPVVEVVELRRASSPLWAWPSAFSPSPSREAGLRSAEAGGLAGLHAQLVEQLVRSGSLRHPGDPSGTPRAAPAPPTIVDA